jgi:hypothetical protein
VVSIEPEVCVGAFIGGYKVTVVGRMQHRVGTCQGGVKGRMEARLKQALVTSRRQALAVIYDINVASRYVLWQTVRAPSYGADMCCIVEVRVLQGCIVLAVEVHDAFAVMRVWVDRPPWSV